jgi:hypothetical protein
MRSNVSSGTARGAGGAGFCAARATLDAGVVCAGVAAAKAATKTMDAARLRATNKTRRA